MTVDGKKIQIRNDLFAVLRSRRNVRIFTLVATCCRNPVSYIYQPESFSTFQGFLKFSTFMVGLFERTAELEGNAYYTRGKVNRGGQVKIGLKSLSVCGDFSYRRRIRIKERTL